MTIFATGVDEAKAYLIPVGSVGHFRSVLNVRTAILIAVWPAAVLSYKFDAASAQEVSEIDSAGVQILMNGGHHRRLDWSIDRIWSVGGERDTHLMVTRLQPYHLAVDRTGRIYVLDNSANHVKILSSQGDIIDSIGRSGGGPGELMVPLALSVTQAGEIGVSDFGRGGLVRWSSAREPVDSIVRPEPMFVPGKMRITSRGMLYTTHQRGTRQEQLVLWTPMRSQVIAHHERMRSNVADFPSCGAGEITVTPLFAPDLVWDEADGQIVVHVGRSYVLDVYEGDRHIRSIRRDVPQRRVTRSVAMMEAQGWLLNDCVPPPEEVVRGTGYAEMIPSVAAVVFSPRGEIFALNGRVVGEASVIDVFDENGRYVGKLPEGTPFPAAFLNQNAFVAVDVDEFDVPRLTLYAIDRRGQ